MICSRCSGAPASVEARIKYGEALLVANRAAEAHAVLAGARKLRPRDPRLLRALARVDAFTCVFFLTWQIVVWPVPVVQSR